jgi:hypothetical protein
MKHVAFNVSCHKNIHCARANEKRIKVGTKEILFRIVAETIQKIFLCGVADVPLVLSA